MPYSILPREEWPTFALLIGCYLCFAVVTVAPLPTALAIASLALVATLHSSLQHECLHGHPTTHESLNHALVFLPLGLFVPYLRFRDTHLAHHYDPNLTDPFEDPESNYLDPAAWQKMGSLRRAMFNLNNTLMGRMVLGPVISLARLYGADGRLMLTRRVPRLWLSYGLHFIGLGMLWAWFQAFSTLLFWAVCTGAYGGLMILRIRTFLEHRAEDRAAERSVIIEDTGPLALLFLNNNYHALHHAHPRLPWHKLPGLYRAQKARVLHRNGGYRYRSYGEVFGRFLFRQKDPVSWPLGPDPNENRAVSSDTKTLTQSQSLALSSGIGHGGDELL